MRLRLQSCVDQWPECSSDEYNPNCCRFPKSCSCTTYSDDIDQKLLELGPYLRAAETWGICEHSSYVGGPVHCGACGAHLYFTKDAGGNPVHIPEDDIIAGVANHIRAYHKEVV